MTALNLNGRARWVDFRGVPKAGWGAFYAALKVNNITGAIRYIDGGSESKQITSAERMAANKYGRKLLLVDETGTGDAWDPANDFAAGQARGRGALADAKAQGFAAIGIAAAADAHATARQVADAVQYARGFASIVGKAMAGFYGFREVLAGVRAANCVSWYWLAGSMPSAEDARWLGFWQDNRGFKYFAGVECDINWRLDGPIPGATTTTEEDDDMQPVDMWRVKRKGEKRDMSQIAADIDAKSSAILAAVAADRDMTPVQFQALIDGAVDKAVEEHSASAADIAAELRAGLNADLLPALQAVMTEVLGDDNADQADQIVDALVDRLQNGATA